MENREEFLFICNKDELKESDGQRFYVNDTDIAVFKIEDEIFVVSNLCPHQHAPSIYEGFIENGCVVCPLHGWTFSLKTGNLHNGSRGLNTYPVKVIDNKIFAKVAPKEINW